MKEFRYSESVIRKTNVQIVASWLASMPCVLVFIFLGFNVSVGSALVIWGGVFLISGGVNAVQIPWGTRRLLRGKLRVDDEKIACGFGKRARCAFWGDVSKVKVVETVQGNVHSIRFSGKRIRSFRIHGFNEMATILCLIKERVPDIAHVRTKRLILDWQNPIVFIGLPWIAVVLTMFTLAAVYRYGPDFMRFLLRLVGF